MTWYKIVSGDCVTKFYLTCIMDDEGIRNVCHLKKIGDLWFTTNGDYVYYSPTHFSYEEV